MTAQKKEAPQQASVLVMLLICLSYMFSSSMLTFINKTIYQKYKFESPLVLFLIQCFWNLSTSLCLMAYKSWVDPEAFSSLQKYGIRVTTFQETSKKLFVGFMLASMVIIQVLFGLYSVKSVNIPLFLTFRRCCILATIIVQYLMRGTTPTRQLAISTTLMVLGAVVAGYESFDANFFGYVLIWGNNFAQAFQNVVTAKFNEDKTVTAFEVNLFFAALGLPLMLLLTSYSGEIALFNQVYLDPATRNWDLGLQILISGSFGILITNTSLLTVTVCGPLAVNISGTLKDVGLTYAGFLFFDDVKATTAVIIGLGLSFAGASYFSYCKFSEMRSSSEKAKVKQK